MPRPRAVVDAPLSPLARRIAARAHELGLRPATIAKRAGLPPQTVSRLLTGQQEHLRGQERVASLARALKTTSAWLEGSVADPSLPVRPPPATRAAIARPASLSPASVSPASLSPEAIAAYDDEACALREERARQAEDPIEPVILSALATPFLISERRLDSPQAQGGREPIPRFGPGVRGRVPLDEPVDRLLRPPLLINCAGAYAVTAGSGLAPRYEAHEVLVVAPGLLAQKGDWVVAVQGHAAEPTRAGRLGHIGRLIHLSRSSATVAIPGEEAPLVLSIDALIAVHPIVLSGAGDLARWTRTPWPWL